MTEINDLIGAAEGHVTVLSQNLSHPNVDKQAVLEALAAERKRLRVLKLIQKRKDQGCSRLQLVERDIPANFPDGKRVGINKAGEAVFAFPVDLIKGEMV